PLGRRAIGHLAQRNPAPEETRAHATKNDANRDALEGADHRAPLPRPPRPCSGLPPGALRACRRVCAQPPHLGDKAPNEGCLLRGVLRERIELWMSQLQEVAEFLLAQRL